MSENPSKESPAFFKQDRVGSGNKNILLILKIQNHLTGLF
jgi:hypothetical protein